MQNKPFFSIIIPTYNRASMIGNTLQSVLSQTHQEYEVIIVDDGSTDSTYDVIHSFFSSNKILYFKIPNSERGYARNFGASKASGKWIYFLDSDDLLYSHHLQTAYNITQKSPDLNIFHFGYEIINEKKIKKIINIRENDLIYGNPYSCHGIFIKKSFFDKFKFNEDRTIAGLEDWELWLRISAYTEIKHFPVVTSALIQHNQRSVIQINKEQWIKKVETFIQYVVNNPDITRKYKNQMHLFYCGAYSYLALHLSFDKKNRKEASIYYRKALRHHPPFFFSRRSAAIVKRILF